ncbi:YybS family protein [Scopulibacillus cellulosilyticus]|uniref:YybS family protein n=1 Tax=Scopulibacillus cellulosilyticus TaxID=2665665 RepID=A0ABW2Q6I7_9BACL
MKQTRVLAEGALSTAIFLCIFLITTYIPFVSIITMWFLPLPIIYFTAKNSLKPGILVLIVSLLLSLLLTGILPPVMALYFLLSGLVMGYLLHLKKSALVILLGGSLANIFVIILLYGVVVTFFHIDPMEMIKQMMTKSFDTAQKLSGSFQQDAKKEMDILRQSMNMMTYMVPAVMVITGVFNALITELVSTPILRRLRVDFPKWPPFREWRFPRSLIWYFLAALIIELFGHLEPNQWLFTVVVNVYAILELVVMIQGFAFIFYLCYAKNIHTSVPIIVVIISLLTGPILLYIIRVLGIIDLGFDLRARLKKK